MQMVNLAFAIYDKSGNLLYGPADNSTIWSGFVGSWTGTNDGDPIVLYDEQADRWMASQFAVNTSDGTQWMLVAISESPDPTGSWHRYAFEFTYMPDYPKFGIWPDGYYLSVNQFQKSGSNYYWQGAGACVLNRDKMIAGDASAEMQFFDLGTNYGSLLPADFDGSTPPPDGAPGYFTAVESGVLQIWELDVDWTNTSSSTITKLSDISVSSFSTSGFTINQPGTTTTLDDLADRLMYRLQYRNFGGYQAMVTNHTVNNGGGQAAVRWYELRKTGTSWSLYQEGTYSPDSDHRWMGSIAMNANGDIGLGYSVSSSSTYPSIRFTGRNNGDPLGQMTIDETTIFNGTSSQSGVSRWGDYSMMSVDPDNDLTFWFTTEYTSGSWNWRTRIASFDIAPIGPSLKFLSYQIDDTQGNNNGKIDAGETVNLEITVQNNGSEVMNNVTGLLSESSAFITVNNSQAQSYGSLPIQGTASSTYSITASANTPAGEMVEFLLHLEATGGHSFDDNFNVIIGQPNIVVIDLDDTKTSGPSMETSLQNLGFAVDYITSIPSNLNTYSVAFVCLGIYNDNHVLSSIEGDALAGFVNDGGKLFMEGGDTWAWDSQTSVHELFNIDGVDDGTSDLATILGQSGTFTSGMNYNYDGQNSYMDHINAVSPAFQIFANQSPSYGCAVAYDQGTYKTIGTSFEFGGMASRASQDDIMEKYLEFFEMFQQQATPHISVNPQSFNQSLVSGETASQNLTISNTGDATLDFSIQIDYANPETGWLTVNPANGNVSPTLSQQLNVTFDASGLMAGIYTANILVSSNDPDSPQVTLPVSLDIEAALIADFTANVTSIYEGESVDFTDLSTGDPTSWTWLFQGAETSSSNLQNPAGIVYNTAGEYNVTLLIEGATGNDSETKTAYITVEQLTQDLNADFNANETTIEEGDLVHFTDMSTGEPVTWQWEIEGGTPSISYQQNPVVVFNNPGIFDVTLTVTSINDTDMMTRDDYIEVTELITFLPPGWEVIPSSSQHVIAVPLEANPRIFEIPIEPGDFVGVFYYDDNNELKCGGATEWTGEENIAVIAWGDDPFLPWKNGFSVSEEFNWRIYSMADEQDYPAKAAYNEALFYTSTFFPLGMSGLTDLFAGVKYELTINQGWSGISSPVDPWNKNLEDVFSTSYNNIVLMNNFDGMLWPDQGINTLLSWDNFSGYNIKVYDDVLVEFRGDAEENLIFDIQAGWDFLPVPVSCEVNTADLFAGHEDDVWLVREISGFNVFWPQFNIYTLEKLLPGKAYMLMANNPFSLEFEPCDITLEHFSSSKANQLSLNPNWDVVDATNTVHTIAISQGTLPVMEIGDIIGVFNNNGQCFGQAQYTGHPFAISVFGDDITTRQNDGFVGGEQFQLLLSREEGNNTFEIEADYDQSLPQQDEFTTNGTSAITGLKLSPTGIGQFNEQGIRVRPNPSNGIFNISGIEEVNKITILSPDGQKVYESIHDGNYSTQVDISNFPKGIYLIRFDSKETPEIRKLIIR
jgi:PKD repeat protein